MSMCRVFSCVVGRGCCYDQCILLAKLLAFALLHSVLQGQICLLLQEFLDFLPLHFNVSIKTVYNNSGHQVVADPPANLLLMVSLSSQPASSCPYYIRGECGGQVPAEGLRKLTKWRIHLTLRQKLQPRVRITQHSHLLDKHC